MADEASERTRGTANRGVEHNMRRGEVHTIVPRKTFNVVGFDIGRADLKKPGFEKELDPIVRQLQRERKEYADGKRATHPVVNVTGHASESVRPGKGPQVYASERADAVKQYLISRDIPPDWIQTTTSRESPQGRRGDVSGSPERKALARSATIEIGESESVAKAAHRRGLENRYADPPGEYLTSREYEARKAVSPPHTAPAANLSRPRDMRPAPILWPQPPLVTQKGELSCWAAVLSSWLGAVRSPKWKTQTQLMEHEQAFTGIKIWRFKDIAEEYGMNVSVRLNRSDFTADRIRDLLRISPLIIAYNQNAQGEEWWHDVVVFGASTDPSGETIYAVMDPGPRSEVANLVAALNLDGLDKAQFINVYQKYFFPSRGSGQWIVAWSKMSVRR
jgi:hypothetical protein